jgi:putative ABC transport system substrate-binding protein
MAALGYREGGEVGYFSSGPVGSVERLDEVIRAHLQGNPDLIFVSSTPATQAVKRLTEGRRAPPVVFAPVNDPLASGIVPDLRHPGGHITGIRLPTGDDLRLQWLKRLAPGVKHVYLPYTADDKSALSSLEIASVAAERLGITLLPQPVTGDADIVKVIEAMPQNADAIFLPRDSRIEAGIADFVALAERRKLPIAAPSLTQTRAGALFSYGFVHRDIGRQAAQLADQILKGAAAGDLPVEMAENRLAINLSTAQRIGLAIPDELLLQAEYVIRK